MLDGVVLVIPAVEGVQSQTRRLAQAVRAAGLHAHLHQQDRSPRRPRRDAARRPSPRAETPRGGDERAADLGSRTAEVATCDRTDPLWREPLIDFLAETNERVIAEFDRLGGDLSDAFLATELRAQIAASNVVPVFFGSAITGAGVPELLADRGVAPAAPEEGWSPVSGRVFKIARRPSGESWSMRDSSPALETRQRVVMRRRDTCGELEEVEERITGIDRFLSGTAAGRGRQRRRYCRPARAASGAH